MILVTGATGILGRVIILDLLKKGKKVRATKRPNSNLQEVRQSYRFYTDTPDFFFDKIEWVTIDFSDQKGLQQILVGVEEVYHTAAKVSFHPKDEKELYKTNIEGTKSLLYACEGSLVKKFCMVSSIAVLDGLNEEGLVDEDSDFNPKLEHGAYAISKQLSEMEVWRASAEGLNVVIVNPGMIIGTGNWQQSSGELFSRFEKDSYTFSGGTSYVDVRDVAQISIRLMEENVFGERFIIVSESLPYAEIGGQVRKRLGLKPQTILSKFQLNVAWWLNNLLGWLVPPLRIVTKRNIQSITTLNTISAQKIIERLNFNFISVKDSIAFHLENYLQDQKEK